MLHIIWIGILLAIGIYLAPLVLTTFIIIITLVLGGIAAIFKGVIAIFKEK